MQDIAALVEVADIVNVIPKVILDVIEAERRKRAVLANICKVDRTLIRTKGRSVHIPKRGLLTAVDVGEVEDITGKGIPDVAYETVEVTPGKIGTTFKVSNKAIRATEIDIINDLLKDAGLAIADQEDDKIKDEVLGDGVAGSTVSAAASTLTFEDLVAAKSQIAAKKFSANLAIMSPLRADELIKDGTRFVGAEEVGRQILVEGAIGRMAGLDILVSGAFPDSTVAVLDRDVAPWLVIAREVDVMRQEKPETDSIEFYVYKELAVKLTQGDGLCHITFP